LSGIDHYEYAIGTGTGNESSGTNYSLSFDGVDDYVNVSNTSSLSINGNVSISAWVNFSNFDNYLACVMSKAGSAGGGYNLEKTATANKLSLWIENGDDGPIEVTTNTLDADTWYHIVGTNDGTTSKIYVDGSLINSVSQGNPGGGEGDFKIGYNSDNIGSFRYWHGNIDEVAVWDDALTADEISALYNFGLGLDASFNNGDYTSSSNLQGYWNFNENYGSTLTDQTSNGNDGTIYGAAWSDDAPEMSGENDAGGTDVVSWTSTADETAMTRDNLTLSNGSTYYVSSRATDNVGNVSATATSDGITVDTDVPVISGVIEGSATPLNYSLGFDGDGDYVSMADPDDGSLDFGTENMTFSVWFKVDEIGADGVYIFRKLYSVRFQCGLRFIFNVQWNPPGISRISVKRCCWFYCHGSVVPRAYPSLKRNDYNLYQWVLCRISQSFFQCQQL